MTATVFPIQPEVAQYIADLVSQISVLQAKITAAAEIGARLHGLDPATSKLSPDFKSILVIDQKEKTS